MSSDEPSRVSPGGALSVKMSSLARRDTAPELALRRALHSRGLRYRVEFPVPGNRRRKIDIAFPRLRIAISVDGCFWHGCEEHGTSPATNSDWWRWKIKRNKDRDADTDALLTKQGWLSLRVWEHEDPKLTAAYIERLVLARRTTTRS